MHELRRLPLALLAAAACQSAPSRPNVLLVTLDTTRADHCSAYGYERHTTPTIERLAETGTRFSNAYAPTASTGPSHASLFTGLYPIAHGMVQNDYILDPDHVTLAERFAAVGYETAAFVGSFVLDPRFGHAQGFATYDAEFSPETSTFRRRVWGGHDVTDGFDRRADATTDRAIAWLTARGPTAPPFLLFVHYFDPHDPYDPPEEYAAWFGGPRLDRTKEIVRRYDAEIAFVDRELGRLLATLADQRLADDTLVIVTADHGEGLRTHGVLGHAVHVYEEAVRVPLVIRWPGRVVPQVVDEPVHLVDVAPSLVELSGLSATPDAFQGFSLGATLAGNVTPDGNRPIVTHRGEIVGPGSPGHGFGLRAGRWKYITMASRRSPLLFDLEADPGERRNVAGRHPSVARRLRADLTRWRRLNERRTRTERDVSEETKKKLEALGYVH